MSSTGYVSIRDVVTGLEIPWPFDVTHDIWPFVSTGLLPALGNYWGSISVGISLGTCAYGHTFAIAAFTGSTTECSTPFECYQLNISTCPIVIDLHGDGFQFSGLEDPVFFDIDADLELDEIGWTATSALDGFLVLDRDGNGVVDDGRELFGNATHLSSGENAPNGYVALAELDQSVNGGNENGRVDKADEQFRRLRIWLDLDHNGRSEASELKPLHAHGIEGISVTYVEQPVTDEYGNVAVFFSSVSLLGPSESTIVSTDVFFVRREG